LLLIVAATTFLFYLISATPTPKLVVARRALVLRENCEKILDPAQT